MSSNTLLSISMITKESMRQLKNSIQFAKGAHKDVSDEFAQKGAKIGSVINIRKPVRFEAVEGAALDLQDVADQYVALTVDQRYHVAFQFSTQELALSIDEFNERYIKPAITPLANKIDHSGLLNAKNTVYNYTGVVGVQPTSEALALEAALQAGALLDENGCPFDDERSLVLSPASQVAYVKYLSGLFNSQAELSKQYVKGRMGTALGFKWLMSQNVAAHTVGAHTGTPAVDTTVTDNGTATIHLDGTLGDIATWAKKGDVIEIASVYAVNPVTKESTGRLMKFVVTADTASVSNEIAALPISPAIYLSGPYQNVNRAPTDADLVTIFGHASTYSGDSGVANIAYHKDAFALGMVKLPEPGGVDMAKTLSDEGLSFRIVRQYDINNDILPCRIDALWGWKSVYPELACKIMG
jgi:hypothetical protein